MRSAGVWSTRTASPPSVTRAAQQGTSTAFLLAPRSGAGVVVLTNMEGVAANDLGKEILKILLGVPAKKQAP
jgi:hypothetical protein